MFFHIGPNTEDFLLKSILMLKLSQTEKGQNFSRCTVFGAYFTAGRREKDTENCAPGFFFSPSYFVTTLETASYM